MGESKTMKRIRVLHSELNGELGGIESFLYNVYRFIDKEKVEFDFLTISDTPAYGDKFKKMGSTVYKVPKHINFLGYYFAIDKILREGNYDIVHMSTIYNKIDITMLSALSTDEAVGYYSYAQRTVNIVLTMCSAVTAIFLPRLSYYYDNEKAVFYKLMDKGFQILCLGVVPLAVGLFLTANQAVVLLYGDSFTPTGTTIKLMCPLILIKGFGDLLCYQLAYSSKNEYILLPGSAIASIINVITNSILIPLYAQNGAVIASVMSELTTNIIQFLYLKRKIKYHISNTALVLSLFSTMVMAAVVCAIIKMNLPLAVALAMEISIGGAIYLLMNIALKNRILSEMLTKVLKKHNTGFQDS